MDRYNIKKLLLIDIPTRLNPHSTHIAYFGTRKDQLRDYIATRGDSNKFVYNGRTFVNLQTGEEYFYTNIESIPSGRNFKAYIINISEIKEE